MSYNKDIDYQAKIDEAAENGDYVSAAKYEQSRNEKIDGEKLDYKKTNKYAGWLDEVDYGTVIQQQISDGASKSSVADTLHKRVHKASTTEGLQEYAYDDIYEMAVKYIMEGDGGFKPSREYNDTYSKKIDSALNEILKRKEFSYDVMSDEIYKYYLDMYLREGLRAMEDTLGKVSQNTGGLASSYATAAANQAYNYYSKKSADIIPELYNDAFERYVDSLDMDIKKLGILQELSNEEYDRFYKDREFDYKNYVDQISFEIEKTNSDRNFKLGMLNSDRNYELGVREIDEKVAQDLREAEAEEEQRIRDEALEKWRILGYLDEDSARILNLPPGLKTSDYRYKLAQEYKIYNK